MAAFTVRLPDEIAEQLDKLAAKLDRSRAYVAALAIEDFVGREAWQLAEAGQGDFASPAELAAAVSKYVKPAKQS